MSTNGKNIRQNVRVCNSLKGVNQKDINDMVMDGQPISYP